MRIHDCLLIFVKRWYKPVAYWKRDNIMNFDNIFWVVICQTCRLRLKHLGVKIRKTFKIIVKKELFLYIQKIVHVVNSCQWSLFGADFRGNKEKGSHLFRYVFLCFFSLSVEYTCLVYCWQCTINKNFFLA